tara:strand:- start:1955 stop:3067 length:1113 start_codon:yes stop_codon:yes gene_type:complete
MIRLSKNKNIVICIGSLDNGGTEKQCFYLSSELLKRGYKITLIVSKENSNDNFLFKKFSKLDVQLIFLKQKFKFLKILEFRNHILSINPQIILCCQLYLNIIGFFSFLPKNIKVVSWIRFQLNNQVLKRKTSIFTNLAFMWQDGFIFNSNYSLLNSKKIIKNIKNKKSYLINNGLKFDKNKKLSKKNKSNLFKIGYIGRIDENKNVITLINAYMRLFSDGHKLKLYIIGDGPSKKKVFEIIKKNENIFKNVEILNFQENLKNYYEKLNVICLPSITEGTSNVIIEAMANYCPVITSNAKGNIELLEKGKYGTIFDLNDPNSLYEKLSEIINDKDEKIQIKAKNAYSYVKNKFSMKKMVDEHINVFDDVLK